MKLPPALLLAQGCAASPSACFVPWATGPATRAVLLLSTPRGAAGVSCPRQGCLSLCTAGAGDKARLLGAAAKLTSVWAGQGAVKWHRGLEGQVHQGCAAWPWALVELGLHCLGSHSLQWGNTTGHRDAPSSAASPAQSLSSWGHTGHPLGIQQPESDTFGLCHVSISSLAVRCPVQWSGT